jgi:hypothetical protein
MFKKAFKKKRDESASSQQPVVSDRHDVVFGGEVPASSSREQPTGVLDVTVHEIRGLALAKTAAKHFCVVEYDQQQICIKDFNFTKAVLTDTMRFDVTRAVDFLIWVYRVADANGEDVCLGRAMLAQNLRSGETKEELYPVLPVSDGDAAKCGEILVRLFF